MTDEYYDRKILDMGIVIPETHPAANYVNAMRSGNLLFLSGKGPSSESGVPPAGKIGRDYTTKQGYAFARSAGINLLSGLLSELGSLSRVHQIVEVQGFVNSTDDFSEHAEVLNGCSDLLSQLFDERGKHARSVFGANSLRDQLPVIVRAIVEIKN